MVMQLSPRLYFIYIIYVILNVVDMCNKLVQYLI